jgi:hypothetical protein
MLPSGELRTLRKLVSGADRRQVPRRTASEYKNPANDACTCDFRQTLEEYFGVR